MAAAVGRIAIDRSQAGGAQVLVERTDFRIGNHVERARHRIARDRDAGGERLDHDQTERVGAAGEDEAVGLGIAHRQLVGVDRAEEARIPVAAFEILELRAAAYHPLGARQIEIEEGLDVLLDREPSGVEPDWPRITGLGSRARIDCATTSTPAERAWKRRTKA